MVKILFANDKENVASYDTAGFTCMHYAAHFGHVHLMKFFKKKFIPYPISPDGTTCLHVAVNKNQFEFVKFLLQKT